MSAGSALASVTRPDPNDSANRSAHYSRKKIGFASRSMYMRAAGSGLRRDGHRGRHRGHPTRQFPRPRPCSATGVKNSSATPRNPHPRSHPRAVHRRPGRNHRTRKVPSFSICAVPAPSSPSRSATSVRTCRSQGRPRRTRSPGGASFSSTPSRPARGIFSAGVHASRTVRSTAASVSAVRLCRRSGMATMSPWPSGHVRSAARRTDWPMGCPGRWAHAGQDRSHVPSGGTP